MKILGNGFNGSEPHGNSNVWRYMALDKFLDLLVTQELHFQNLSNLTDRYEGGAKLMNKKLAGSIASHLRNDLPTKSWEGLNKTDTMISSFVHCWSLQAHESYALWKIYLGGAKQGVAVMTSLAKLRRSILNSKPSIHGHIHMGNVKYFKPNPAEVYEREKKIFMKMPFYNFEQEYRIAISQNYPENYIDHPPENIRLKVDLDELIKSIYISPFMSEPLRRSFEVSIKKLAPKLSNKIRQSEVLDQ